MLNTMIENKNSSFTNISIPFRDHVHSIKTSFIKTSVKFVTYDNIYTNQLKLKVKISKVIMEGNC